MRFETVEIRRFGCLEDVIIGTPETALPSIVAILGSNESGKSTFFAFLMTLLYGFYPAKRTTNPYTPWLGEDPPEGRARIRLDDGEVQEIHRRLLSAPWGMLHASGREESVSNKSLPCVAALGHVPREVFQQVYALTLTELSGLEGKSWDLVQDRLVGSMGTDLKPAGKIVSEFEDEAKKLWRPDKMGKPLHKRLQSELDKLRRQRRAAENRDQDLRSKVKELAETEADSRALEAKQKQERKRRTAIDNRLNVLLPVRKALSRIEERRARAGPSEEVEGLPANPRGHLQNLRDGKRDIQSRINKLRQQADSHRNIIERERPNIRVLDYRQNVLLPVREKLSRIENLRVRAAPSEELKGLPPDPRTHLGQLKEAAGRAEARVEKLDGAAVDLRNTVAGCRNERQAVAVVEQKVSAAASRMKDLGRKVNEAEGGEEELNERCGEHARDLFTVPWHQVGISHVSVVPVVELEERVRRHRHISRRRVGAEDGGPGDGEEARRPGWKGLALAIAASVAGAFLTLRAGGVAGATGIGSLIVGIIGIIRWGVHASRANKADARWSEDIATLKSKEEAARDEVRNLVGELPIRAWLLESLNFNLLLERFRRLVELSNELAESKRVLARRRTGLDDETSRLRKRITDDVRELRKTTTVQVDRDLRAQATALQEAARIIQTKIDVNKATLAGAETDLREAMDELRSTGDRLRTFEETLASFADGSVDRGLDEVIERLDARNQARQLQAELEQDQPNLDEVVAQAHAAEADGESWDTLKERLKATRTTRDQAKGKLGNIESQLEEVEKKQNALRGELDTCTKTLASFADGSVDRGLDEVIKRLDARNQAHQLQAELEQNQPNLDEVVAQVHAAEANGETWDSLAEDLKVIDTSLQGLIAEERELGEPIGRLKSEIRNIEREETASQVQEEIELLEAQMLDVRESRDRLFLLAKLVQEADRRFREEYQPALLNQAGKYVDQITGGRYDRIVIGEAGEKFFSLRDPANSQLRKMSDPFSKGIKEQVYFALRLAAIEDLDADQERLPLFLDEVFVNWDEQRLGRAFGLVEQVARQRQVFFFTCHEAMASRLEAYGGMIVDLN